MRVRVLAAFIFLLSWQLAAPRAKAQDNPAPVSHDASTKAHEAVTAVEQDLSKAQAAIRAIQTNLEQKFEASAPYMSAEETLKSAQTELETVTKPILQTVHARPAYQAALAAKHKRQAELDALRKDPDASKETVQAAAAAVLQEGSVASKMESDAFATEPKVAEARKAIADAETALTEVRSRFRETLRTNADWLKATKDADAVKKKLTTAQVAYRQAMQQEATAEAARQQQIAQANRQRNQNNNNSRR